MTPTAVREHGSLLAVPEKRLLIWIAGRLPTWISSDHLTLLALVAMGIAGASFAAIRWDDRAAWGVVIGLVLNWFGDSLDGTLARVRRSERPRYGYYVDHVLDIVGTSVLMAGLALSGRMMPAIALIVLVAYLLVAAEVFLATAVHGVFRMSFLRVGPTELRIVLAAGALALLGEARVDLGAFGHVHVFDAGGAIAAAGLFATLAIATVKTTRMLARLEPSRFGPAGT